MTEEQIKKEMENRKLKSDIEALKNTNIKLNMKLKTAEKKLNAKVLKDAQMAKKKYKDENKELKKKVQVADFLKQRLEKDLKNQKKQKDKEISKKDNEINEKNNEINALKKKIIELQKKLDNTVIDRDKYKALLNIDGTTAGIPTSMTPINKKKVIPNTREKTGKSIGGQKGHEKHKLEKFKEEEINENETIELSVCPKCNSKKLIETNNEVTKDELDYEVRIIKKRYHYKEYKCLECDSIVRKQIPGKLKEDNQYGSHVQATALTLANIGNMPMNKIRKIVNGLTMNEIDLSEGYIAKLQKRAASKLEQFIQDLKAHIIKLELLYWDDTIIFVNKKRSCIRFYGDENAALYIAHEHKDKNGITEDNILPVLSSNTKLMHDHNKVNYGDEYSLINLECCEHLMRDLERVTTNIPERTWSKKMKNLFKEYITKRNELVRNGKDSFSEDEADDFVIKINEYILLGYEENKNKHNVYYAKEEKTLIERITEYRDNYIYWIYDFDLPTTNNLSERALRGIKSKMKSAGQFQNIERAKDYGTIRSYIETCYRNGVNGHEALIRLIDDNPYTLADILALGKEHKNKSN